MVGNQLRVAAYQSPLAHPAPAEALDLLRPQIARCTHERVSILCCPEAMLGGLADYGSDPFRWAIAVAELESLLRPLANNLVTTIVGFTERSSGRLYNSAAIFHRGRLIGIHRKVHPAINTSVYAAGTETSVFHVGALTFGVVICYDLNFPELAGQLRAQGASVLFVPSNNGMPPDRGGAELVELARAADRNNAVENSLWVVRADVAGHDGAFVSYGSSAITDPQGRLICASTTFSEDLLTAEIAIPSGTERKS
jgi:predicted amidohydrolase